jgi:SAM-dependent methyltransferase
MLQEMRLTATSSSEEAYDAFASHFRAYSESKAAYIEAIDRIVTSRVPSGARSLFDVGAGDGARAVRLASACGFRTVVLAEPSPELLARCRDQPVTTVWHAKAEELPATEMRFDVVTCLWNVLGHIPARRDRVRALENMRELLADGGTLFVDVNNRYNARAYGWARTLGRIAYDALRPSDSNGDVVVVWRAGERVIQTVGHVFTPREMEGLFDDAGLKVTNRYVVDYRTGERRGSVLGGQLLYELVAGGGTHQASSR